MAEILEDGKGTGYKAEIDSDNRLYVNAVSQSVEHFTNYNKGTSFNLISETTPATADDYYLYIKNTGTTPIVIEGFSYRVESDQQIKIYKNLTGTSSSFTTLTPVN